MPLKNIVKKFSLGDKVKCRAINFNYMDRLVNVTMKQSEIDQPFLTYNDLNIAEIVKVLFEII